MFESLQEGLQSAFKSLRGQGKLTEANMREGLKRIELSLVDADVNYDVIQQFMEQVTERALGQRVLLSLRPQDELVRIVHDELVSLLGPVDHAIPFRRGNLTKIMLCGLQGSGKTTTCGKLAKLIKERGIKPFLVAADLQRPAAIEQLKVLGSQLEIPVHAQFDSTDPVQVCRQGLEAAKIAGADLVIFDTAGRLAIDHELMEQLKLVDRTIQPDQVMLVVDGMTGQDAVNSARAFNEALELDGVILTKLDGDARGGALLSVKAVTQVPIKFIGTGEHMDALEPFRPEGMAGRILQMGDIVEVAREAHRLIDEKEKEKLEQRMASGQFSLDDFRELVQKMRKPGLMQKMLGLMPGMGSLNQMLANTDNDKEMSRLTGIIDSMTPAERRNPKIIDNSRRVRIAAGSGVAASQVNELIKQFNAMTPIMQMMAGGGMGERMKLLQQLQGQIGANPMGGLARMKQSTGKRLTPKEREKMQKEREKKLRQMKRRGK
jgi:signal recognition particle subunit SRP54